MNSQRLGFACQNTCVFQNAPSKYYDTEAIVTIDALGEIVTAVRNQAEVFMDGGIRRGTDILKALALGAKAVLLGRPILWGLAIAGSQGVQHVIELLRDELDLAMALTGCATLQDIDSSLIKS